MNNLLIKECELKNKDSVTELVFLGIDWGRVLMMFDKRNEDVMKILLYRVTINNVNKYTPESVDPKSGVFTFKGEEILKDEVILVTHNLLPMMEHHFNVLLADYALDYHQGQTWKPVYQMDN